MTIIPGLILLLAGQDWFDGAAIVGWILLAVGAIQVLFFAGAFAAFFKIGR